MLCLRPPFFCAPSLAFFSRLIVFLLFLFLISAVYLSFQMESKLTGQGIQFSSLRPLSWETIRFNGLRITQNNRKISVEEAIIHMDPLAWVQRQGFIESIQLVGLGVHLRTDEEPTRLPPSGDGQTDPLTPLANWQSHQHQMLSGLRELVSSLTPHMAGDSLSIVGDGVLIDGIASPIASFSLTLPADENAVLRGTVDGDVSGSFDVDLENEKWGGTLNNGDVAIPRAFLKALPILPGARLRGSLEVTATPEDLLINIDGDFYDLYLFHESIGSKPLPALNGNVTGGFRWQQAQGLLQLEKITLTLGKLPIEVSGWAEKGGAFYLKAALASSARAEDIPADFVESSFPALRGLAVEGPLMLWGELKRDDGLPHLTVGGDVSALRLLNGHLSGRIGGYPLEGRVYAPADGEGRIYRQILSRRSPGWVPLHNVAPSLIQAIVTSEDALFYQHSGVSTLAISEAFQANMEAGRVIRGGSTLTQQLAKNLFLTGQRTLTRKVQESVLAWELERRLTKDQILETYVNIIEWGPGIYGIEEAADSFFGKDPRALTLKESAYLASVIPGPRKYHRYVLAGELTPRWNNRVNELLLAMKQIGQITTGQYRQAVGQQLHFVDQLEAETRATRSSQ